MSKFSMNVSLEGLKEVESKIYELEDQLKKKVLLEAFSKASKPLIKAAKSKVPVSETSYKDKKTGKWKHRTLPHKRYRKGVVVDTYMPGNLMKSIGSFKSRRIGKRSGMYIYVGPKAGRGGKHDGWYGHFLEYGTKYHAAQPFLRPAFEQTKGTIESTLSGEVLKAIEKFK